MRIRRNRIEQLIESLLDLRSKINREQNQTKEEMILKSEKEIIRSRLKVIERENENQKGYRSKGNRKKAITLPRGVVLKEEKMVMMSWRKIFQLIFLIILKRKII